MCTNGIRTLIRRAEIRVDPEQKSCLLRSEPQSLADTRPIAGERPLSEWADAEDGIRWAGNGRDRGPGTRQEQARAILIAALGMLGAERAYVTDACATLDDRFRIVSRSRNWRGDRRS